MDVDNLAGEVTVMDEIIVDFKNESKALIRQMRSVLDEVEGDFDERSKLEKFGQVVDRIMGGADTVAMVVENSEQINTIARYAQLCKVVGYKASQLDNEKMFGIVVAFLLDATEMLEDIVVRLGTQKEVNLLEVLPKTFLDRLKWIADKFDKDLRASVAVAANDQAPTGDQQMLINDILKGIGIH